MWTASTLLVLSFVFILVPSSDQVQLCDRSDTNYVTCDHTTPVCECTTTECYFCFEIEQRHTFTRYFLTDDDIEIPGYGGRVLYFNDQGQLEELPPENPNDTPSLCMNNSLRCTDAYTTDGNSFRPIITVNNRFPAPTLIVPNNSIVVVDVYNRLSSEATTIHWHGMHQMNTPWMDGVEHITQCGIAPSSSFRYIFRAFPPGTHWYHSHSGAQRTDGLFGALIVRESRPPDIFKGLYPVIDEPEYAITLIDWQKVNSLNLFAQIHAGIRYFDQDGVPPTPTRTANANDPRVPRTCSPDGTEVGPVSYWSGLINGLGRHRDVSYNKTRLSTFTVSTHRYYRFRLIGAQSLFAYRFSIDEHRLTLVATDGHFVQPTIVDFIIVHSGERYDFILETKNPYEVSDKKNFVIRAETLEVKNSNPSDCSAGDSQLYPLFSDHNAEAILHYGSNSDIPANTMYEKIAAKSIPKSMECLRNNPDCIAINCPFQQFPSSYKIQCMHIHELNLLEPITDENKLPDVNTKNELFLNFGFEGDGSTSTINGRNFVFPSIPLQLASDKQSDTMSTLCDKSTSTCDAEERLVTPECLCTQSFDIDKDKTYRFVFTAVGPNRTDNTNWNFAHSIHLHGHSFHVAKIGFGTYNNSTGRIMSASDDITCVDNSYICTNPQWTTNSNDVMGRRDINRAPLKDTVLIPAGGYAVVYIKANNPGYWFLHCHIEVHQMEGMAVVINEAETWHNPPPTGMPECGSFSWDVELFKQKSSSTHPRESLYLMMFIILVCIMMM